MKFVETAEDEVYVTHYPELKVTAAAYIKDGWATIGLAVCGSKDQWSRKIGRHIAVGRAKKIAHSKAWGGKSLTYNPYVPMPFELDGKERIRWAVKQIRERLISIVSEKKDGQP